MVTPRGVTEQQMRGHVQRALLKASCHQRASSGSRCKHSDAVGGGDVSFNGPATGSSSSLLYYRWITLRANHKLARLFWQLQGPERQTPRRSSKSFLSQQGA